MQDQHDRPGRRVVRDSQVTQQEEGVERERVGVAELWHAAEDVGVPQRENAGAQGRGCVGGEWIVLQNRVVHFGILENRVRVGCEPGVGGEQQVGVEGDFPEEHRVTEQQNDQPDRQYGGQDGAGVRGSVRHPVDHTPNRPVTTTAAAGLRACRQGSGRPPCLPAGKRVCIHINPQKEDSPNTRFGAPYIS